MGLSNYSSNSGGGGGPQGPGGSGAPVGNASAPVHDIKDILIDYNARFANDTPTLFRDGTIAQAVSVLISKNKANPLLVGAAGTGKTKVVEDIARRIAIKDPLIPKQLARYTIYECPLSSLIAGAGIVGELESRMVQLIDFATDKAEKAIIFIDEIHLIQDKRDPTYSKIAQILKPALARGDIHVIGATTLTESRELDKDPAFARRFSRLIVEELTRAQTVEILRLALPSYLVHYKNRVGIKDEVLDQVAKIADENSRADMHRPDNALTLLDKAMADAVVKHSSAIAQANAAGDKALALTLSNVPTLVLREEGIKNVAKRLMTGLSAKTAFDEERVVAALSSLKGQSGVLPDLVESLRREDLAIFPKRKPTTWMLAGPSGCGKTETAKILAEELTGQPPIALNMADYATAHEATKLVGSPPGYVGSDSNQEKPFDSLESNPYRVILLDELEKAHVTIHQLLLAAFDEGWLRLADGKRIDFSKAIIIATTNADRTGGKAKTIGFGNSGQTRDISRQELVKNLQQAFSPEFLGRFTQLVAFSAITREIYTEILVTHYAHERERILVDSPRLSPRIPADIDPELLETTVDATYLEDQGARPAEAAARRLIEDSMLATTAPTVPSLPASAPIPAADDEEELVGADLD